ncbi:hypothetical protein [Limimaricola pyoseonensis]|uniref:Uncharacterized protein n=1 Tax=Limimaricola pyoseonensis TaxID=521013 RepID=A0A1G7AYZ1_9RHOB|nr:hypothetical protein [Limimaricola pyoseonensis]SDE20003.1 hypothetical protein SAMN04488567_1168 [Limimaricola pyoseonensis]
MPRVLDWAERLTDPSVRAAIGRRLEELAVVAFNMVRWSLVVGFTRLVAQETGWPGFRLLDWLLSALLFAYLLSVFMLRPEIPIFSRLDSRRKRLIQSALNSAVCMAAFMAAMMAIDALVDTAAQMELDTGLR